MSMRYICLVLMAVAASANKAALTSEEISALNSALFPGVVQCAQEFVSGGGLARSQKHGENPISCFYACVFKKYGAINQHGLFDVEVSKKRVHEYIKTEDKIAKMYALIDKCSKVNHESVSDGVHGCDRSKLLAVCYYANLGDLSPF